MAIFGNKLDADLPLLTQLYQLEPETPGELVAWLRRAEPRGLIPMWGGLAELVENPEGVARDWVRTGEILGKVYNLDQEIAERRRRSAQVVNSIVQIVGLVRRVMDAIVADDGELFAYDLGDIAEWITVRVEFLRVKVSFDLDSLDSRIKEGDRVPVRSVMLSKMPDAAVFDPVVQIKARVGEELVYALERARVDPEGSGLERCQECKSVFQAHRRGQRYCSHRCGDRVSRRRARAGESDPKRRRK